MVMAGTASSASNKQKGVCLCKTLACSYGIYNLVGIFLGYLSPQLIYFTYTVTTGLAISDEDSVLIIRLYAV